MKGGYTTGSCAAAGAKAATILLSGAPAPAVVDIPLLNGTRASLPVEGTSLSNDGATAWVRKDAGDDPDVTHGCLVVVHAVYAQGSDVQIRGGQGVGVVTRPGLQVPPGEAAINPGPRRQIVASVRELTQRGLVVTVSIPNGLDLATKTMNGDLGIVGGLSILGTDGTVRPFSHDRMHAALTVALDVAKASNVSCPILVPGHYGRRAALRHFNRAAPQVVEVSNAWGFMLDACCEHGFTDVMVLGHPGKLAKLAQGSWDTHSSKSASAVPLVAQVASSLELSAIDSVTVEGQFAPLTPPDRHALGQAIAQRIHEAIQHQIRNAFNTCVVLIDMQERVIGSSGDLTPWT